MKKVFSIIAVAALALSFASCGGEKAPEATPAADSTATSTEAAPATEPEAAPAAETATPAAVTATPETKAH